MATNNSLDAAVLRVVRKELEETLDRRIERIVQSALNSTVAPRLAVIDRLMAALQTAPAVFVQESRGGNSGGRPGASKSSSNAGGAQRKTAPRPAVAAKSAGTGSSNASAAKASASGPKAASGSGGAATGGTGAMKAAAPSRFVQGARIRYKQGRGTLPGVILRVDAKKKLVTVKNEKGAEFVRAFDRIYA